METECLHHLQVVIWAMDQWDLPDKVKVLQDQIHYLVKVDQQVDLLLENQVDLLLEIL